MSDEYPTLTSGVLAVIAASAVAVVLGETDELRLAAAGAGVGAVVLVLGVAVARSRTRTPGLVIAAVGFAVFVGGFGFGVTSFTDERHIFVIAPPVVGVLFVALGVAPLRGSGSRRLTKAACWLVFAGVVLSVGFELTETALPVLVATVGAALVWDLGENSVSIGRQVGRSSWSVVNEGTHAFGSVLVGVVSGGAAYTVHTWSSGASGYPLETVVMMLVAIVLLIAFLHK